MYLSRITHPGPPASPSAPRSEQPLRHAPNACPRLCPGRTQPASAISLAVGANPVPRLAPRGIGAIRVFGAMVGARYLSRLCAGNPRQQAGGSGATGPGWNALPFSIAREPDGDPRGKAAGSVSGNRSTGLVESPGRGAGFRPDRLPAQRQRAYPFAPGQERTADHRAVSLVRGYFGNEGTGWATPGCPQWSGTWQGMGSGPALSCANRWMNEANRLAHALAGKRHRHRPRQILQLRSAAGVSLPGCSTRG